MGEKDVVIIEKGELTGGSTWHAAGLVGQLRSSRNVTRMLRYSTELYDRLEAETEQNTGFKSVGGLRVASTPERWEELKALATMAKTFGLPMDMHTPEEAVELFPLMIKDDIVGASNLPTDGYADPNGITLALSKGARGRGATFYTHNRVVGMKLLADGRFEVETQNGKITAEYFLNCAGNWSYELGQMLQVNVPIQPMEHQFMQTKTDTGNSGKEMPTMRDPDNLCYYKQEGNWLTMGGYEHKPMVWADNGVPTNFGQQLLISNFEQFEQIMEPCLRRTPDLADAEIHQLINGPEAFTTDGNPIMGEVPEVKNYFVAAGFNAFGIAAGGGAGKMMAEWILSGAPSIDLWKLDVLRFGKHHRCRDFVRDRTIESYAHHYAISWPEEEMASCRPLKISPLYQCLKDQGAVFGTKFGWERPNWFAPQGVQPKDIYSFDRPNWFEHVGNECKIIREKVAIIDQSSFSKFEVTGVGSLEFLQRITDNQIDKPIGSITYTQMLTGKGGIACDLTVTRLAESKFYITTGTAFETHDLYWMNRSLPTDGTVTINTVTGSKSTINLCGPKSRQVLEAVSRDDVSNEKFPYLTAREITIGYAPVLALRVTYVGELGWELHIPTEYTLYVYHELWKAGQSHGMINAGYRAIESLRLEKGYRYWSDDITPDYTPYEAGLGFCVKLDKGNFIGREALITKKRHGLKIKLCTITVDDPTAVAFGKEAIMDGEKVIASVTSAGYGHTIKKTILFAYLPLEYAKPGTKLTVEIRLKKFEGRVENNTIVDPKNIKVKM